MAKTSKKEAKAKRMIVVKIEKSRACEVAMALEFACHHSSLFSARGKAYLRKLYHEIDRKIDAASVNKATLAKFKVTGN